MVEKRREGRRGHRKRKKEHEKKNGRVSRGSKTTGGKGGKIRGRCMSPSRSYTPVAYPVLQLGPVCRRILPANISHSEPSSFFCMETWTTWCAFDLSFCPAHHVPGGQCKRRRLGRDEILMKRRDISTTSHIALINGSFYASS